MDEDYLSQSFKHLLQIQGQELITQIKKITDGVNEMIISEQCPKDDPANSCSVSITPPQALNQLDEPNTLHLQNPGASTRDAKLAKILANKLNEPRVDNIYKAVVELGHEKAIRYFGRTLLVQAQGGIKTYDGKRMRTAGGIFFRLIKDDQRNVNKWVNPLRRFRAVPYSRPNPHAKPPTK